MTTPITITDLTADAKAVYNVGPDALIDLADKYGVTTPSLTFARENPHPVYASLGAQALGTKSTKLELQKKLYAMIKGRLREMGA